MFLATFMQYFSGSFGGCGIPVSKDVFLSL